MSILKAFNNHFIEFLDDVLNVFPDDKNIKTANGNSKKRMGNFRKSMEMI